MSLTCQFVLNGETMSSLNCGELGCIADRQWGGRMGTIRDFFLPQFYRTDRSS